MHSSFTRVQQWQTIKELHNKMRLDFSVRLKIISPSKRLFHYIDVFTAEEHIYNHQPICIFTSVAPISHRLFALLSFHVSSLNCVRTNITFVHVSMDGKKILHSPCWVINFLLSDFFLFSTAQYICMNIRYGSSG